MMDDHLLNALKGQNTKRAPIWLMRQAGRYMPEYRAIKTRSSLLELFHHVDAIVEITRLPIHLLNVDAAILFSDILTVLDGLSLKYTFEDSLGPVITTPVVKIEQLIPKDVESAYPHIRKSIQFLKRELKVPLIGFAGAPFTIASYLIEGKTSKDFRKTKKWMFEESVSFKGLLDKITDATIDYLNWQIDAGVDALQIFDSWAQVLSPAAFENFTLPALKKIRAGLKKEVPLIFFCRGTFLFINQLKKLGYSALSFDWGGKLSSMRSHFPKTALQGNLDPALLYASKETIAKEAQTLLEEMKGDPGFIFNLGHGILPDTPFENVKYLVDTVRNHS